VRREAHSQEWLCHKEGKCRAEARRYEGRREDESEHSQEWLCHKEGKCRAEVRFSFLRLRGS